MSQKFSNNSRFRSPSIISKKSLSNMPKEYIPSASVPNPRPHSSLKIEDKLMNQQIITKKKIESLKKTLEEEQLREIREKPKILEKSRILAERAEKKFLEECTRPIEMKNTQNTEKVFSQVQPDPETKNVPKVKISVEKVVHSVTRSRSFKKKSKSLLNLSVIERSEAWMKEKQEKIGKIKKLKEEKELAECTFSPTPKFLCKSESNKKNYRCKDNASNNISFISTPRSNDHYYEYSEQNSRITPSKKNLCKQISPFQVNISFKCGIDLKSFLRRAK